VQKDFCNNIGPRLLSPPGARTGAGRVTLMSSVKHRTHDWDISTRRREVDWVMVVQRRGRDLKTSVIKL